MRSRACPGRGGNPGSIPRLRHPQTDTTMQGGFMNMQIADEEDDIVVGEESIMNGVYINV
jgi:hypothetical protein